MTSATDRPGFVELPRSVLEEPVGVLFERQAARTPDRLAVKGRRRSLTYAGLDRRANQLARAILDRDPGAAPVACSRRSSPR
jgi:non-ribosomal peptide synthetase component F